jgi:ParB family transcriptional regulator, chromosome partitioning protein
MDLRFVSLAEINLHDDGFEIRKFAEPVRLRESLAHFGILDPPWLLKKGSGHIVVDGFKRLRWAEENGAQGTVCRIFPEDFDAGELWSLRIEKRLFEPEINIAEKAQIISTLLAVFKPDQIPRSFLSALNVANRPELLRKWASLWAKGPETLAILASGAIAERPAIEVADWDERSRVAVLAALKTLRCSASIQVEIVEHIDEIAIRDEKERAEIIETHGVREIMASKEFNHRQKTQALRDLLAELRYPRLSSRHERFRREIESLGLPPRVRIIPPPAFEGNNWRIELSFTGPEELRKVLDSAGAIVGSDCLETLLRPRLRRDKDTQNP